MRAVVTGATGFLGRQLVEELIAQKNEVTILVRDINKVPEKWASSVHVIEISLEELAKTDISIFHNSTADLFFHMAWSGTSGNSRADISLQLDNVKYTCDAVKLAKKLNCSKFINAGSIMEYEVMQFIPKDDSKPGLGNIYSIAKLTADCMAKTLAMREEISYINVIISNIYGVGEKTPRFLNSTLRKMLKSERIPLTQGTQLYDFIYITDAAKAIVLAAQKGKTNHSYYIGNEFQQPLKDFVIKMKFVLNSKSELIFGEVPLQGAMLTYKEFDTKALSSLGFKPEISFDKGIQLTRDWILESENEYQFYS